MLCNRNIGDTTADAAIWSDGGRSCLRDCDLRPVNKALLCDCSADWSSLTRGPKCRRSSGHICPPVCAVKKEYISYLNAAVYFVGM